MSVLLEHKKKIPGPSDYNIPDKEGFEFNVTGKGCQFNKTHRRTITDQIATKRSEIPSPNLYSPTRPKKIQGGSNITTKKCGLMDVATYHGQQSPSSAKYGPITLDKIKPRSPNFVNISVSKTFRFDSSNLKTEQSPSPCSYSPSECVDARRS